MSAQSASSGGHCSGGTLSARAPEGRGESMRARRAKGRWTLQEHHKFLVGLERYGKDWKAIGDLVRSRTVVQIRTHAQKYFLKTEKGRAFPEEPYESTEDDGVTDSSGFGSSSSDSESLSPDNDDKSTATTTSATATTTKKRSSSTTSAPSSFRSRATGDATSARRGILTTSPTTRGKRLARLGDSCAVTSPRETRASAAAAAAAAAASAATDDHDAAAGGEEQGGASLESGDAKRRKIERPASADIVVSAVGGVQEVMKTASGSIFTASNQDPMSKRFRGKRLSVSGKANGDQRLETSPGGCLTAGQGFGFASLQVETALPGGLDEDLSLATPTFGKGESSGSTVWSTVGDMERADAGSRDGSAGLTGWGVDVTVPSRHKSPFLGDTFLEELLGGKDLSSGVGTHAAVSSSSSSPSLPSAPSSSFSSSSVAAAAGTSCDDITKRYLAGNFLAATLPVTSTALSMSAAAVVAVGQQRPMSHGVAPRCAAGFDNDSNIGACPGGSYAACTASGSIDTVSMFHLDSLPVTLAPPRDIGADPCYAAVGEACDILGENSAGFSKSEIQWPAAAVAACGADGADYVTCTGVEFGDNGVFGSINDASGGTCGGGSAAVVIDRSRQLKDLLQSTVEATDHAGGQVSSLSSSSLSLSLSSGQQVTSPTRWIENAVAEACGANAGVGASLVSGAGIEDGPLGGNWLSFEGVEGGMGEESGALAIDAAHAATMDPLLAFDDHFGML